MRKSLMLIVMIATTCVAAESWGQSPTVRADYKAKCEICHGRSGLGDTALGKRRHVPPFNDSKVVAMSDAGLIGMIENGSGQMPPFKGKLTAGEVKSLLQYIHTLQASH